MKLLVLFVLSLISSSISVTASSKGSKRARNVHPSGWFLKVRPQDNELRRSGTTNNNNRVYVELRGGGAAGAAGAAAASHTTTAGAANSLGAAVYGFCRNVWLTKLTPILQDPEKNLVRPFRNNVGRPVQDFLYEQTQAAAERRKYYRDSMDKAVDAEGVKAAGFVLLSPSRVIKIFVFALFLAEAMTATGLIMDKHRVGDKIKTAWKSRAQPAVDWYKTRVTDWWRRARGVGGIFTIHVWKNPILASAAFQQQVSPKYQWATGAALGMIASPVAWMVGTTVLRLSLLAYALSEGNHFAKDVSWQYDRWLYENEQNLVVSADQLLEDVRGFVRRALQHPKSFVLHVREQVDDAFDDYLAFPPDVQRGILVGGLLGLFLGA